MQINTRQFIVTLVGLTLGFLLLITAIAGAGQASLPVGLTPTVYVHLPLVVKQPDDLANEQSIADQINQQRDANALPPLTLVSELTQAARRHSRDMADNNFTSHTGSDGSTAGQRMREAGYDWIAWGEIIGWGFGGDPERMVNWWMNSPTHRSIILSSTYEDYGVGYARNPSSDFGHYWTVNFGKRANQALVSPQEFYVCTFISRGSSGGSSLILYGPEPCE